MSRVQRVFCFTGSAPDRAMLGREHPGLILFDLGRPGGRQLLQVIGARTAGDIFLVDPRGNLMMRYGADISMKGMHEDLKRLLKLSQIG